MIDIRQNDGATRGAGTAHHSGAPEFTAGSLVGLVFLDL